MGVAPTPLRWPAAWKDPGMVSLLQATPIRHVWVDPAEAPRGLAVQAQKAALTVIEPNSLPPDVAVVTGPWPGVRLSPQGGDRAAAGPTGEPWIDSSGWRIRIAQAQRPRSQVWVDSKPQPSRSSPANYVIAFADAAAHHARWIISLDDTLAAGIASKKLEAMEAWKRITDAAAFFAADQAGYTDEAVIGVLSTFTGSKAGFTGEVLNNLARTKQQYRAIAAPRFTPASLAGLKGVIFTDPGEPPADIRKAVLDFVASGGMLIIGAEWASLPRGEASGRTHPRFAIRKSGKGSIAVAAAAFSDPYRVSNDAVVLVGHRDDVVRYFNTGAITPCLYTTSHDPRAVLETVFYSLRPVEDASVWVKGSYRSARIKTWTQQQTKEIKLQPRDAGVEIYLPPVEQYAMIELES